MTQLEFIVNSSVPAFDIDRLSEQTRAIYVRLCQGWATNAELAAIALKYTSRLHDLHLNGIRYEKEHVSGGTYRYRVLP